MAFPLNSVLTFIVILCPTPAIFHNVLLGFKRDSTLWVQSLKFSRDFLRQTIVPHWKLTLLLRWPLSLLLLTGKQLEQAKPPQFKHLFLCIFLCCFVFSRIGLIHIQNSSSLPILSCSTALNPQPDQCFLFFLCDIFLLHWWLQRWIHLLFSPLLFLYVIFGAWVLEWVFAQRASPAAESRHHSSLRGTQGERSYLIHSSSPSHTFPWSFSAPQHSPAWGWVWHLFKKKNKCRFSAERNPPMWSTPDLASTQTRSPNITFYWPNYKPPSLPEVSSSICKGLYICKCISAMVMWLSRWSPSNLAPEKPLTIPLLARTTRNRN